MKRILALILALLLCLGFVVSCENEEAPTSAPESSSESTSSSESALSSSQSSSSSSEPKLNEKDKNEQEASRLDFEYCSVIPSAFEENPKIEVLVSYEELVAFSQEKGLYVTREDGDERIDFDPASLESIFNSYFVLAVPNGFESYEDLRYTGIEQLENGNYLLMAVVTTNYEQILELKEYKLDLVIAPCELDGADMKESGVLLNARFKQIPPTYNIPEDTPYNNKVANPAKEKLHSMSEGEYISLSIFLSSPPHTAVQGSGYTSYQIASIKNQFYANFSAYKREHGEIALTDLPADVFRELSGLNDEQILNDYEIESCLESVGGLDYTIKLYGIYKDQREYRQSIKNANMARNEEFCALLDMTRCRNVYKDSLLCVISLECERDYVLTLQEMELVRSIYWSNPDDEVVLDQELDMEIDE